MPTKPILAPEKGNDQRSHRYVDTFYDQHKHPARFPDGRPWWGDREFAAERGNPDGFCSNLNPGDHNAPLTSSWEAPWLPETRFFEYDYRRARIRIRYDLLITERQQIGRQYYAAVAKACLANGWPEVAYGAMPRESIRLALGDPPESPKVPQAAMAGDPWVLGFTDEPNEELAKLLGASPSTGFRIEGRAPASGVITPAQALAKSPDELAALIARIVEQTLDAREQAKRSKQAATMRAAKAAKATAGAAA